ncbi:MAG TPA: DUF4388 domain-containing protein, partial [Candidatus Obscuribacterales bacterium]
MRELGLLKGSDLVKVLATLQEEGIFADKDQTLMLKLGLQERRVHVELYFQGDVCVHAHSSDYDYRLEELLLRKRLLDRNQLEELKDLAKAQPELSSAELILAQQWLAEVELAQVVTAMTEIISYEVMLWKDTAYELRAAQRPARQFFGTGLPPQRLMSIQPFVKEAKKHLPVLVLMRDHLGNPNAVLRRIKQVDQYQLSTDQYHVYRYINNRNNIRELVQLSELNYFDTLAALYQLLSWGYVSLGQLDKHYLARKYEQTMRQDLIPGVSPGTVHSQTRAALDKLAHPERYGKAELLAQGPGSDLLQVLVSVLEAGYEDGCLIVKNLAQDLESELALFQGSLVHAATTAFETRLGDLLIRRGVLDPAQLEAAVAIQKTSPDSLLGEILVSRGLIDEAEIPALIQQQMEAVLYEVLAWPEAAFYFDPDAHIPQYRIQHKIPLKAAFEIHDGRVSRTQPSDEPNLLEAADENLPILLMMRDKYPSLAEVPYATAHLASLLSMSPEQENLMQLVGGRNSLQDLLLSTHQPYFPAFMALFHLLGMGALKLRQTEEQPAGGRPATRASVSLRRAMQQVEISTRPDRDVAAAVKSAEPVTKSSATEAKPAKPEPLSQAQIEAEALALLR